MTRLLCLFLLLASPAWGIDTREGLLREYAALIAGEEPLSDSARLARLFDLDWRYSMLVYPEYATNVGIAGYDDRWTDMSEAGIEQRKKDIDIALTALQSIDRAKLTSDEQLYYDLFLRQLKLSREFQRFPDELLAIGQLGGVHQNAPQLFAQMPKATTAQVENILARLRTLPALVEQNVSLLRRGMAAGVVPPKITLRDVPEQVLNLIPAEARESSLLLAFKSLPESISTAERDRLQREADDLYKEQVAPAFQKLHDFLTSEYIPAGRSDIAWTSLPHGAEWYALCVRSHTTTELTPQEIHDIGLREVARIHREIAKVMQEADFKGTFDEFTEFLRTDRRFFFSSDEELLMAYRDISKRIDPELGTLFGKLPRLPYGVRPVPPHARKSAPTAYYERGSTRTGRGGYFFANTYDLDARPSWEMEALTLHEAVPGHHLQIALAQELENVPEWRKNDSYTAYIEGWGLYAESLGYQLGLYLDPYQKYGRLSFEMWRACRLVVDTGMHALGWSRDQALDFMRKHSGRTEHNIVVEVDRYIVWPGQALAYKIGELKIQELRGRAETALGEAFDLRAFHDLILGRGALPLDVLERLVDEWITNRAATQKRPAAPK